MYKPNFCAECGEKIARTRWRLWTSRSFCPNCERRFRRARVLTPLIASAALLSTGLLIGGARRPQPAPLMLQRAELPLAPSIQEAAKGSRAQEDGEAGADSSAASQAVKPEARYGPNGTATERPTEPDEVVSICGARTQKGTPCQRRVRGTGRCWQHRAMP
jgi:hypothetical protein